jgi:hypothetical protein
MVIHHEMFLQTHGYLPSLQIFEQKEEGNMQILFTYCFCPPQNAYLIFKSLDLKCSCQKFHM